MIEKEGKKEQELKLEEKEDGQSNWQMTEAHAPQAAAVGNGKVRSR